MKASIAGEAHVLMLTAGVDGTAMAKVEMPLAVWMLVDAVLQEAQAQSLHEIDAAGVRLGRLAIEAALGAAITKAQAGGVVAAPQTDGAS